MFSGGKDRDGSCLKPIRQAEPERNSAWSARKKGSLNSPRQYEERSRGGGGGGEEPLRVDQDRGADGSRSNISARRAGMDRIQKSRLIGRLASVNKTPERGKKKKMSHRRADRRPEKPTRKDSQVRKYSCSYERGKRKGNSRVADRGEESRHDNAEKFSTPLRGKEATALELSSAPGEVVGNGWGKEKLGICRCRWSSVRRRSTELNVGQGVKPVMRE